MKFESIPLDEIRRQLDFFKLKFPERMRIVSLRDENLTEYGIDIYGEQRLQDVIDMLNSYPEIEQIEIHIGLAIRELIWRCAWPAFTKMCWPESN